MPTSNNILPSFILIHPHIAINRRAECCKSHTSQSHRLWATVTCQCASSQTSTNDAVPYIILRSQALDTAFCARKKSANHAEVFGRGVGGFGHVLEAVFELLADR